MITAICSIIAGVLGVLALIIPVLWQRRNLGRQTDYDARLDIEQTQDAATRGDESAVQSSFAEWAQKGRMRDPRRTGAYRPPGVHLYEPPAEGDRSAGGGRPSQDSTG